MRLGMPEQPASEMKSGSLFSAPPTLVKSPICMMSRHCGYKAALEAPEDCGGCVNTELTCLHCGATGVISERKDLA
jgi:hypothetical protein